MRDAGSSPEIGSSDINLIQRTAAGDRSAFAALYRRYNGMIYRFARLMTGCSAAAEDVVQEVFLALMRSTAHYDPSRAALATYLYGIARYHTRRRLLQERRFVTLDPDASDRLGLAATNDTAGDLHRRSEIARLRRAILALPSRYREVVVLCDLQDVSYADAAATLECPIGTVRSRLHRARQLLSEKLQRPVEHRQTTAGRAVRCAV